MKTKTSRILYFALIATGIHISTAHASTAPVGTQPPLSISQVYYLKQEKEHQENLRKWAVQKYPKLLLVSRNVQGLRRLQNALSPFFSIVGLIALFIGFYFKWEFEEERALDYYNNTKIPILITIAYIVSGVALLAGFLFSVLDIGGWAAGIEARDANGERVPGWKKIAVEMHNQLFADFSLGVFLWVLVISYRLRTNYNKANPKKEVIELTEERKLAYGFEHMEIIYNSIMSATKKMQKEVAILAGVSIGVFLLYVFIGIINSRYNKNGQTLLKYLMNCHEYDRESIDTLLMCKGLVPSKAPVTAPNAQPAQPQRVQPQPFRPIPQQQAPQQIPQRQVPQRQIPQRQAPQQTPQRQVPQRQIPQRQAPQQTPQRQVPQRQIPQRQAPQQTPQRQVPQGQDF